MIHLDGMVKVDVFVAGDDPFNVERLKRGRRSRSRSIHLLRSMSTTAERSVLRKLEWFRRGGEVSDRQWRDVVAILKRRLPGSINTDSLAGRTTWAFRTS